MTTYVRCYVRYVGSSGALYAVDRLYIYIYETAKYKSTRKIGIALFSTKVIIRELRCARHQLSMFTLLTFCEYDDYDNYY